MNRIHTLVQELRGHLEGENTEQAVETLDELENRIETESPAPIYAVINETGTTGLPVTIAHIGPDEAVFRTQKEAETARQQLAKEYGHDNFRVNRVVLEPVPEGEF